MVLVLVPLPVLLLVQEHELVQEVVRVLVLQDQQVQGQPQLAALGFVQGFEPVQESEEFTQTAGV